MHKLLKSIIVLTVCVLFSASVYQTNAQGVESLTPVPAEISISNGEYRFEGEPKVKYVTLRDGSIPAEAYKLKVDKKGVTISSCDPAGVFYAFAE